MAFKPRNAKDAKKRKDDKGSRGMFKRRKFCRFTAEKIAEIDYKDVERASPGPGPATSASCPPPSSARATWR